jgi:hypothetical protein
MLDLTAPIESTLGKRVVNLHPIGRGYSPAQRMVVSFADGSSLFAKRGTSPLTVEWLRQEKRIYETLTGSFMARYLGWIDSEPRPRRAACHPRSAQRPAHPASST